MRIIEGMGPPTQDTFGNSDYLYKDTETGAFYRCHGNINEDRVLPYGPAHRHPGEQYLWTPTEWKTADVGVGAPVTFYASRGRMYTDENKTVEVDDMEGAFIDALYAGKMAVVYDVDNDWFLYLVTSVISSGYGYLEVHCGHKVFYTDGHEEPM